MRKEILIAIFVGLSMGLIITFGVYRVRTSLTDRPETDFVTTQTELSDATATPTVLALHSPEDGLIQTEQELTVTGTTIADSNIVLFVNNEDYISHSDESGNFSFRVTLSEGVNIIRVHVLDNAGTTSVEERLVVVSDAFEKLEAAEAEREALEATASAEENPNNTDTESGASNE